MSNLTQKLTIEAELQGGQQTAQGLQKIAEAQRQVHATAWAAGAAPVTPTLNPTPVPSPVEDDANLKLKDFTNLLGMIDPRLASMTMRLGRASQAFGDLGTKAIDFSAVGKGLVETLTRMGPALALLAAGGAVAAGLGAIAAAMARMREETAKANEELERLSKANDDLKRSQADSRQSIEAVSDARRRGGFDASTSQRAQAAAAVAARRYPKIDEANINAATGNLFDVTQEPEELAEAAFLLQIDEKFRFGRNDSAAKARARFERAKQRNRGAWETFRGRQKDQDYELFEGARRELISGGTESSDTERVIRRFVEPGLPDEDVAALAKRVKELGSMEGLEKAYTVTTTSNLAGTTTRKIPIDKPIDQRALRFFNELNRPERGKQEAAKRAAQEEAPFVREKQRLEAESARIAAEEYERQREEARLQEALRKIISNTPKYDNEHPDSGYMGRKGLPNLSPSMTEANRKNHMDAEKDSEWFDAAKERGLVPGDVPFSRENFERYRYMTAEEYIKTLERMPSKIYDDGRTVPQSRNAQEAPQSAAPIAVQPIVYHQYNGRYLGSDASAQRRRMNNGESKVRRIESRYI